MKAVLSCECKFFTAIIRKIDCRITLLSSQESISCTCSLSYTLASGIDVGPTFINFGFFSRPYGLIREYIKVIQMVIYYIEHVYLTPYVYSFCQIFQALRLFPALHLFRRLEQASEYRFQKIRQLVYLKDSTIVLVFRTFT